MSEKDRFSLGEGFLYGVPLHKSKDIIAWQQGERMIKAQEGLKERIKGQTIEVVRQAQGAPVPDQARNELIRQVSSAIHGFVEQQRNIASGIYEQTQVIERGFHGVMEGQTMIARTIEQETREQTAELIEAQQFQMGNVMGGAVERPTSISDMGIEKDDLYKLVANGSMGYGTPASSDIAGMLNEFEVRVLNGGLHEKDFEQMEQRKAEIQDRLSALKSERYLGYYAEKEKQNLESELKKVERALPSRRLIGIRDQYKSVDTLSLLRSGKISAGTIESLIRHQKLPSQETDRLLESRLVRGPLGSTKRINIVLDDQLAVQEEQLHVQKQQMTILGGMFQQNERRDELLSHISQGISGQLMVAQHQLMTTERTNELIEDMARDLVGRLDLTNSSLDTIVGQLDQMTETVAQGLQQACLVFSQGFEELGKELALTRFLVVRNLQGVMSTINLGVAALDERLAVTNQILSRIEATLQTPEATKAKEACQIALDHLAIDDTDGSIQRLKKTDPDSNSFELVQFLLGYSYSKAKDIPNAAKYLGRAKKFSLLEGRKNPKVAEQASLLLAQMALELGEISLSIEALQTLVNDQTVSPQLAEAHGKLAALQAFAGHEAMAVDNTINQLIVNPTSVDELIASPSRSAMTSPKSHQKWQKEVSDLIQQSVEFDSNRPHLFYLSLSILLAQVPQLHSLAEDLLGHALRIWKKRQFRLKRDLFENEIRELSPAHSREYLSSIFSKKAKEKEFFWLHI